MRSRIALALVATSILLSWPLSSAPRNVSWSADKTDTERVRKIVEVFKKYLEAEFELFNPGLPPGTPREAVDRYFGECYVKFVRLREELVDLLQGNKPCPEGVVEMILTSENNAIEFLDSISRNPLWPNIRIAYIQVLDGADPRLKEKLPKLREHFTPCFETDRPILEDHYIKKSRPIPKWYVDRAFTCSVSDYYHPLMFDPIFHLWHGLYGLAPIAAIEFSSLTEEERKFMFTGENENDKEVYYSIHVIEAYGTRRWYNRVQPQDAELARKQLKWLWETKRWWARRYVVEILDASPELAFENIIEELKKENHPYVGYRIQELKLEQKLKEQLQRK